MVCSDVGDMVQMLFREGAVVRDDDQRPIVVFKSAQGQWIESRSRCRRFVQQHAQDAEQRLRQQHANLFMAAGNSPILRS